jgi:outer membrane protein assembly factor BamB
VRWQLDGDLADAVAFGPVAADGDNAYALLTTIGPTGEETTELVAADLGTGTVRWRHEAASSVFGIGPVADDGVVVVTDGRNVVTAIDARDGSDLWTYRMATEPGGNPAVADGVVHVIERGRPKDLRRRDVRVVTLDLRTGRYLASFEPPPPNDVVLPIVGSGPSGELLVPGTSELDQNVLVLEVHP